MKIDNKNSNIKKKVNRNKYDIFNLPPRLFKYYSYDSKLNIKRLAGEVYLASPYDFNDPCDCQRTTYNNTSDRVAEKGEEWLERKMRELNFLPQEAENLKQKLQIEDNDAANKVRKRMLERLGVLCLTESQSDTLMWGYYANNEGICIEYDVTKLVRNMVVGFVNKMDYSTTMFLYEEEKYSEIPSQRSPKTETAVLDKIEQVIRKYDVKFISNKFLLEKEEQTILNFMQNILLKRMYAKAITYGISPDGSPVPLFFQRGDKQSETKYFKKTKTWEHEQEFRFIASLGGRLPINIGKECIKNVYLGCNMSNERILAISYLMAKNELSADLYKMERLKNCGLKPKRIDWRKYKDDIISMDYFLTTAFPVD